MTDTAADIKRRRVALGWSQEDLARRVGGISQGTIAHIERGRTHKSKHLIDIYRALDEGERAMRLSEPHVASALAPPAQRTSAIASPSTPVLVPVYFAAQAGDGYLLMRGEVSEDVEAPPAVARVPGVYALRVVGDSMEPVLRDGDLIFVHPRRPVRPRHLAIFIGEAGAEGQPVQIKQYLAEKDGMVLARQFNPDTTLEIPRASLQAILYVWHPQDLWRSNAS